MFQPDPTKKAKLLCYFGAFSHDLYDNNHLPYPKHQIPTAGMIRYKMRELAAWASDLVHMGPHIVPVAEYLRTLAQECRFCVVPKGVGNTNGRLTESIHAGVCVCVCVCVCLCL